MGKLVDIGAVGLFVTIRLHLGHVM